VLNKPAILGGIVLFPTFAPNSDVCGFGGNGRLFAVFYETGTAYKNYVMGEKGQTTIVDVIGLGEGVSSSFGVHVGKEEGGTIYGQMSTGVIQQIEIIPAFNPKSIPIYWREE
jgi:type IV pilus assembly protein PilY1